MEMKNTCPGCGNETVVEITASQFEAMASKYPDWVCGEQGDKLESVDFCSSCLNDELQHPEPHYDPN